MSGSNSTDCVAGLREEEVRRGILEFSDFPTPSSTRRGKPMVYDFLWLSKTDLLELTFTEEEVKMLGVIPSLSPSQLLEPSSRMRTSDHLRYVESMATVPSDTVAITRLNAVILGVTLASEEDDLFFPSHHVSQHALVPSPQKCRGRGGQKRKRDALEKGKGMQLLDEELDEEDGGEEEDLQFNSDLIRSDNDGDGDDGDDGTATGYDPYFKPLDTDDPLWL
ncbi:hypothetical protein LguiB_033497 [Lonicera macranthoides]